MGRRTEKRRFALNKVQEVRWVPYPRAAKNALFPEQSDGGFCDQTVISFVFCCLRWRSAESELRRASKGMAGLRTTILSPATFSKSERGGKKEMNWNNAIT